MNLPLTKALVLLLLLACPVMLAGCGGESSDDGGDEAEAETEVQTPQEEPAQEEAADEPLSAQDTFKAFLVADLTMDLEALQAVSLPHDDLGTLFDSIGPSAVHPDMSAEQAQARVNRAQINEMELGGQQMLGTSLLQGIAFPVREVDGVWKIDPAPLIASRQQMRELADRAPSIDF